MPALDELESRRSRGRGQLCLPALDELESRRHRIRDEGRRLARGARSRIRPAANLGRRREIARRGARKHPRALEMASGAIGDYFVSDPIRELNELQSNPSLGYKPPKSEVTPDGVNDLGGKGR